MSTIDLTDVETQWLIQLERQPQLASVVVPRSVMERLRALELITNDGSITPHGRAYVARRMTSVA